MRPELVRESYYGFGDLALDLSVKLDLPLSSSMKLRPDARTLEKLSLSERLIYILKLNEEIMVPRTYLEDALFVSPLERTLSLARRHLDVIDYSQQIYSWVENEGVILKQRHKTAGEKTQLEYFDSRFYALDTDLKKIIDWGLELYQVRRWENDYNLKSNLTDSEMILCSALVVNFPNPVIHRQLVEIVWMDEEFVNTSSYIKKLPLLRTHIMRLNGKLERKFQGRYRIVSQKESGTYRLFDRHIGGV